MIERQSPSDCLLSALDDPADLVRRIVAVTGLSTGEVIERLQKENREPGVSVREEFDRRGLSRYEWSDGMSDFYDNTDAFLFETIIWNRSHAKHDMRRWIADFLGRSISRPARILTFGDGLGFDSLYFAFAGHEVEYLEVSQTGIQFTRGLFADHGVSVKILAGNEHVQPGDYDAVVCLDVLEHIPNPSEVVKFLASAIRDRGYLLVHAPFWYVDPAVVTHLRENRRFSGDVRRLYRPHGLCPVDGKWAMNPIALQKANAEDSPAGTLGTRLRLALGQHLLWYGRFWSTPHILAAKKLVKSRSWPQLDALQQAREVAN